MKRRKDEGLKEKEAEKGKGQDHWSPQSAIQSTLFHSSLFHSSLSKTVCCRSKNRKSLCIYLTKPVNLMSLLNMLVISLSCPLPQNSAF